MSTIVNTIQEIVRHEMRRLRVTELGIVEAVYPHSAGGDDDNYGCDVRLKNSGLVLKRVPVLTGHIGSAAIPNVGDLVLLAFDKGDVNQPVLLGRLYNEKARPPLNNPDELIFRLPLDAADDKTLKAAIRNLKGNSPPREILVEMPPKITMRISDGTVRATAGSICAMVNSVSGIPYPLVIGPLASTGVTVGGRGLVRVGDRIPSPPGVLLVVGPPVATFVNDLSAP